MNQDISIDLITLYVYTTGINLLIIVILFLIYITGKRKEKFILDFTLGFAFLLLSTLSLTFLISFDFDIRIAVVNALSITGYSYLFYGFTRLFNVHQIRHRWLLFTGIPIFLILALFSFNLNVRIFIYAIFFSAVSGYYLFILRKTFTQSYLAKSVIFVVASLVLIYVIWSIYSLQQPEKNYLEEMSAVEMTFFGIMLLITHILSAQVFIGISQYHIDIAGALSRKNELLMKEMNHRVNNSLNRLIGLIQMLDSTENVDENKDLIVGLQSRILSISKVHEQLYRQDDTNSVRMDSYITDLIHKVLHSFKKDHVEFISEIDAVSLNSEQSLFTGMILNELTINSCKYAFEDHGSESKLYIGVEKSKTEKGELITITYHDNGPGSNKEKVDKSDNGYGSKIIQQSLNYLEADVFTKQNSGYEMKFSFIKTEM